VVLAFNTAEVHEGILTGDGGFAVEVGTLFEEGAFQPRVVIH
jgi:hypothetical protein